MSEARETVRHSIIVPLYNERENIVHLYGHLKETLEAMGDFFELVFVDDGSTDDSAGLLREIASQDGRVTVVTLTRNAGKSAALGAGFDVALGDYIVTMDGDLQHDAADIPRFIGKLRDGYDIVCGQRLEHAGLSKMQQLSNRAANWVSAKLSGLPIHDFGGGFKAYKREYVAQLPVYGEMQRLIPILALRHGSRICEIPITVAPREHGTSKYGFLQKVPFFFDLITARFLTGYLSRPMHFFGSAGILMVAIGSIIAFCLLAGSLIYRTSVLQQHAPLMFFSTVLILSGMQLFALGLLAEMQVRHFHDRLGTRGGYSVQRARHLATKKMTNPSASNTSGADTSADTSGIVNNIPSPPDFASGFANRPAPNSALDAALDAAHAPATNPAPDPTAAWYRSKPLLFLITIVLFWALIYVPGLASPGMMDDADSEHAEIAREMLQRHDFVTMYVNGVRYLDKAPLPYWIAAATYRALGISEFSVRLPLALFALASLFAVYFLGREIAGDSAGFFGALVLGTAIGPYIYTRFDIPDIMIGFWLILTVHLFWRTLDQPHPSRWLCWGLAAVTAADVLTKGLIGVVFPVLILGGYLLLTGARRHVWRLRPVSSSLIFLALAAPWHILATLYNPPQGDAKGFFWFYFINEQVYRYLNMRVPRDYDRVPLLIFWGLLFVWIFPWTFFVLGSLRQVPFRPSAWRAGLDREGRAALLCAVWALAILAFFSFSTRQEYYVLPSIPALALLCGLWLGREEAAAPGSVVRASGARSSLALLAIGILVCAITLTLALISPPAAPGTDFAGLLQDAPATNKLSLGPLFHLTLGAMSAFRLPLVITGAGLLVGTLSSLLFRKRGLFLRANLSLAAMMVVLFYAVHLALTTFSPVLGSQPLAAAIRKEYQSRDTIVVDGPYSRASSINFYTGAQIHMLNGRINNLWYGSLFPDSPAVFEDDASFAKLWRGPGRIFFVVTRPSGFDKLQSLQAPYYLVARAGGKTVYSNRRGTF